MSLYEGDTYTVDEYKKLNTATGKPFGQAGEEVVGKQAQDWRDQGFPMPGTKKPDDIRSLGDQLIDWTTTPAGNATLGGLGLLGVAGIGLSGLKGRRGGGETPPRVEPTFNDIPPQPPSGGGPKPNFPQGDVTDVASRPVGQPRMGLPGPTGMSAPAPAAPPAPPMPPAPPSGGIAGAAPAPTNVAPSPIAPVDPLMQAKIDALSEKQRRENEAHIAQQRRLDEQHQTKLANEAKRAESMLQKNQGKAASPTSSDQQATQLLVKSEENKVSKAVAEASKPKPVAPPAATAPIASAPITPASPAPAVTPVAVPPPASAQLNPATLEPTAPTPATQVPTAKQASNIKEISLPKEWPSKGMNWITSMYGVDGARDFIDKYNDGKPFKTHDEMKAVYEKVMTKPSFSTMPKEVRKERGIKATERDLLKIVPRSAPPPGGASAPVQGGGSLGSNRPGEDIMHNLNPLKL